MKIYLNLLILLLLGSLQACHGKKVHPPPHESSMAAIADTVKDIGAIASQKEGVLHCSSGDSLTIVVKKNIIHKDTLGFSIYSVSNGKKILLNRQQHPKSRLILSRFPRVELNCRLTGFYITNTYHRLSSYEVENYVFKMNNHQLPALSKVFILTSGRNSLSQRGKEIDPVIPIRAYNLNNQNLYEDQILFSIQGIQSGATFSIEKYLAKVRSTDNHNLLGDPIVLESILNYANINSGTIEAFNNIAYYLQQSGALKGAIFLLKKIISKFPDRTVAYINLGDAYWGLGNKSKARDAYRTYSKQMEAASKTNKIPRRVTERLK